MGMLGSACMFMIYIFIYSYIHICMHACMYTYINTYMHTYIHTCIHTYMHTYIQTYIHLCIQTYIHTYIHTHKYIHPWIHTCMLHTLKIHKHYIHTYTHTRTHTYIHKAMFHDNPRLKVRNNTGHFWGRNSRQIGQRNSVTTHTEGSSADKNSPSQDRTRIYIHKPHSHLIHSSNSDRLIHLY